MAEFDKKAPAPVDKLMTTVFPGTTVFDVVQELEGAGKVLTVKHEPAELKLMISGKRAHRFANAAGFIAYVEAHKHDRASVLADMDGGKFYAILDEDALYQYEVITFVPMLHPIFTAWNAWWKCSTPQPLAAFVNFMQLHYRSVDGGKILISQLRQMKGTVKLELFQGVGSGAVNGSINKINIQSGTAQDALVELPEKIVVRTPMYLDTEAIDIEADLVLGMNGDKGITVQVSAPALDVLRFETFQKYFAEMESLQQSNVVLGYGVPIFEDWKYQNAAVPF